MDTSNRSNVRSATATIVDEHRQPITGTQALAGAEGARKDADEQTIKTVRQQFLEAAKIITPAGDATRTWIERITEIMRNNGAMATNKALAARKRERGEKATYEDVYLSQTRQVNKAFFGFPTDVFDSLIKDAAGNYIGRESALRNIRAALDAKAAHDRQAKTMETLAKAAEVFGFKGEQAEQRIAEAVEAKAAEEQMAKEFAKTPEGKADGMARSLINLAKVETENGKVVDWTEAHRLLDIVVRAVTDAAKAAMDNGELIDSEAVAFGLQKAA